MPLDLKRLRQDPSSFVASVCHSLHQRRHWQHESSSSKVEEEDDNGNDDDDDNKDNGNFIIQNDDDDPRIKAVVRFHQESAATLQELQQCRAKRNEQKKQQRQQVVQAAKSIKANNDNSSSSSSASEPPPPPASEVCRCPTKQDEEALEVSHRKASEALQRALLQLPNYVDETIYTQYSCGDDYSAHDDDDDDDDAQVPVVVAAAAMHPKNQKERDDDDSDSKTSKSTSTTNKVKILPQDAFYCLGGYEDLMDLPAAVMESINNGNNNNGKTNTCTMQSVVLTDLGMQLLKALEKILIETLSIKNHDDDDEQSQQSSSATTFASWTLPETMPLSIHNIDSIWPSCCCGGSGSVGSCSSKNEQQSTAISQQQYNSSSSSSSSSKAMVMNAPSWMGLLRYHLAGKTYYDRELPMYNFLFLSSSPTSVSSSSFQDPALAAPKSLSSSSTNNNSTCTAAILNNNNTLQDAREVQFRNTWSTSHPLQNNGKKGKHKGKRHLHSCPWYKRIVAGTKRIEVCILTGPSLQADSRIVQESTMQRLCDFYKSLLLPSSSASSSSSSSSSSSCGIVRIRAVPPSQLLPAESSRLVLEGHWPPMVSSEKSSSKPIRRDDHPAPVCLAYLSNLQDYASCFHDAPSCTGSNTTTTQQQQHLQNHLTLRHGNSRFGERVHILTGTVCSLTETLEWMMQHNAVMTTGTNDGVDLPARVAAAMQPCWSSSNTTPKGNAPTSTHVRLAYRRTVTTNKHGKRIVTNMPGNIEHKPHSQQPIDLTTTVSTTSNDKESFIMENDTITSSTRRSFRTLQVGQKASPHQIRMEKLSCPFGFLPFYHC